MSFALTLLALLVSGLAWLRVVRLDTGRRALDLPLAWFTGGAAFATVSAGLRLIAGVPYTRWSALLVLALPFLLLAAGALARRPGALDSRRPEPFTRTRAWPRPSWLFAPLIVWVLVCAYGTLVHGFETPTQSDDGVRVRAFTPLLAFADTWGPEARSLLPVAGSVPTWVPSLAWRLTGQVDAFHVNYVILTSFVALLVLLVGLGASRGSSERGWASAFAVTSLPLFVYHCTTTYTDALLAIHLGVAFAFFLEYERTHDPRDAARALFVLVAAAFVKREGATLALCMALPLIALLVARSRSARGNPESGGSLRRFAWLLLLVPLVFDSVAQISAVGLREAFPVVKLLVWASDSIDAPVSESAIPDVRARALAGLAPALFRSGNAGMLYWAFAATLLIRLRSLRRSGHVASLAALLLLLGLWGLSSVWLVPAYSVDQSTIHRALLGVSVPVALWVAALLAGTGADGNGRDARIPD